MLAVSFLSEANL